MVHTSKSYQYTSYEEFRDNGMITTEANSVQYLYNMKILPMTITECSTTKYRNGYY